MAHNAEMESKRFDWPAINCWGFELLHSDGWLAAPRSITDGKTS